ncbi:thiamine pyrophosphate-binding protein [Streptosporangium amethystogenes subsp. fukuiense]|uniref:Thiamine pyrophosphate-binding protein n=1 Tax=Streptosporangium amethystogenes subsp. fukuiense TaxID=698418 RepID=A0ABW2SUL7_9ACTN
MNSFHAELARVCAELGTPLFGVTGDSNLFFVDSFVRRGGRYVAVTHEGAAVLMAAGYASVSDRVGLATVTQGAITNAATALADATRSRLPLVLFAGETPSWDDDNVQRVPTDAIVRSSGAEYLRLEHLADADDVLSLAFRRARRSARPVVVGIPTDHTHEPCSLSGALSGSLSGSLSGLAQEVVPTRDAVRAAVEVLLRTRRPLILAGRGAIAEADRTATLALARRLGARVATTLRAKELFRGEPADLGIFGGLRSGRSAVYFDAADVIVAVGAGLNSYTTHQGTATHGRHVVHIDVDAAKARSTPFVHGSAAATARALLEELAAQGVDSDRPLWDVAGSAEPEPARAEVSAEPSGDRRPGTVEYIESLELLESLLPPDRLLTVDGGRIFFESVRRISVASPRDYVHTMSMGSIGLGLSLAMGAAVAAPTRLSVAVSGDGGFMLGGLSEFTTAVRRRLKLLVVVLNDGCYGAEHHHFVKRGHDPATTYFDWPDFAPVARSLGGHGVEVRRPADFQHVADAIAAGSWPLLVDVKLDPNRIPMDFHRVPPAARAGGHP